MLRHLSDLSMAKRAYFNYNGFDLNYNDRDLNAKRITLLQNRGYYGIYPCIYEKMVSA